MKYTHYQHELMTLVFLLAGYEPERARADAKVALFLLKRRKGERTKQEAD